ncbi:MAG: urea ABC transporter substrate-binding protein [Rhodocyclales bacterium]|nr:urea ABC transporter substrate-binding protein [Rhodocyclales bacterium]
MDTTRRLGVAIVIVLIALAGVLTTQRSASLPPLRIGVLHSLTGTMAASERPLVDAARLAVEEINAAGGLLGRPVEILVADSRSDPAAAAAEAERLIVAEGVSALFACWTSACRKALLPVVERHRHLMFFPLQYEGLEQSPNIFYTGLAPNQQILPGTRWALDHLGRKIYLLGSDYIFPRTANRIIRDLAQVGGGELLAERYRPLGDASFDEIVAELQDLKPDVVLNTLNGDSNLHFFRALHAAGLDALPVMSFSIAEGELRAMGLAKAHPNHYAVWSYFGSLPGEANRRFVAAFQARYGTDRVTSGPIEAAYVSIKLWAQAVRDAGSEKPGLVNLLVQQQSIAAPSGLFAVDRSTRHMWRPVRIGKERADRGFDLVWDSGVALRPMPFPDYRSHVAWQQVQLAP